MLRSALLCALLIQSTSISKSIIPENYVKHLYVDTSIMMYIFRIKYIMSVVYLILCFVYS